MIGMVIAVVRGYASDESLELCWTANKVDVPTAPALGLMLNKVNIYLNFIDVILFNRLIDSFRRSCITINTIESTAKTASTSRSSGPN